MPILLQWSFKVLRTIETFNEELKEATATTTTAHVKVRPFKTFSLFPIVGWTLGHITYDKLKFQTMSKELLNHKRWQELFKWKSKYNNKKLAYLKTDGVSVCLVFENPRSIQTSPREEEEAKKIQYNAVYEHIIGVDTGRGNFFAVRKNYSIKRFLLNYIEMKQSKSPIKDEDICEELSNEPNRSRHGSEKDQILLKYNLECLLFVQVVQFELNIIFNIL